MTRAVPAKPVPVTKTVLVPAVETMKSLRLYDALQPKFVEGANITQAFQFVDTGNAELGFVALSQLMGNNGGSRWLVPQDLYKQIRQDAVLLKKGAGNEAARFEVPPGRLRIVTVPYVTFPFAGRRGTTVIDRSTAYPVFGWRAGRVAVRLAREGRIEILRKGRPVPPDEVRGVIRLRLRPVPDGPAQDSPAPDSPGEEPEPCA